ncbi:MAG: aerotolerance regulator BatA, partial [Omnitrophica WOR_2 bacterium RIFOXYC2_FULL_43_9]
MFFHNPLFLLFIPFAVTVILYSRAASLSSGLKFSTLRLVEGVKASFKLKAAGNLFLLRALSVSLIILALARPQSPIAESKIESEGIEIVLALDCSTSMLAEDFTLTGRRQNRLEVIKAVVKDFIKGRTHDRIGIVAFAARAYMVCPLTLDYGWLLENLERIKAGLIEDGTALGSGIASSLNRLKNVKAKSKVLIVLTDGRNNTGTISPLAAAEAASALKVKIYTIGAGTKGLAP